MYFTKAEICMQAHRAAGIQTSIPGPISLKSIQKETDKRRLKYYSTGIEFAGIHKYMTTYNSTN